VYFDNNLQELLLPSIVNHVGNCVNLEFVNHVENCVILGFVSHVENCVILGFVVWGLKKDKHNQFKILLCGYHDNVISIKLRLALMDIPCFLNEMGPI
jgi:hypothetical protein